MTLRTPLNFMLKDDLLARVEQYIGEMKIFDGAGECIRTKLVWDVDRLRSDEIGLFWQIQYSGAEVYMVIGASPASLEFGHNVFGTTDVKHCAKVLIGAAEKILGIPLPSIHAWDCRRMDVTHNYLLDTPSQVKQALKEMRNGDGIRQKASVPRGDTVYYGEGSDLIAGKAYDKGTQIIHLQKKLHKLNKPQFFDDHEVEILKRVLRLELMLRRRWFDRLQNKYSAKDFASNAQYLDYLRTNKPWLELTPTDLDKFHNDYFSQFIGNIEVTDMEQLLEKLIIVAPSAGRARAAHTTWALIKTIGYEQVKATMPNGTFTKHRAMLLKAGLSQADLQSPDMGNVLQFKRRKIQLDTPIVTWSDMLRVA